ncbi:mariner Mos1 transposase [Trichonephila clavipes]|nr:mariner Mos1 transposase [Trichonephila clavipes]
MEIPLRTAYGQNGRCGMQPKAKHSLRAQAHQSKSRTETCELVKVKQKLLEIRAELERERERRTREEEYVFLSLSQTVTGDETWNHHFEPESKRQSKQWKRATSPPPRKSKDVHTSSGKGMMSFFYHKDPLLIEFLERETTISVQRYQATLQNLRRAIKSKHPGMLSKGVTFLHDKCANSFGEYF